MAEQIVYDIRIEGTEKQANRLNEIEAELAQLNSQRKKYLDLMKENIKLDKESQKHLADITATTKALSQEKAKLTREINNTIKANTAASKSYDSLTAANAKLSARLRAMEDPLGKNKKQYIAIAAQINSNTDKLKEMDAAMGRHQRNVGNYSGAIRDAFGQMGFFSREIAIAASAMNLLKTATQNSAKGATTFKSAMQIIKIALVSTGIGLVVIALGSLYKYFTSSSEAALKFKNAIAPVAALLGNVMEIFQSVGKTIFDAFSNMSNFWSTLVGGFKDTREQLKNIIKDTKEEARALVLLNTTRHNNALMELDDITALAKLEAAIAKARDDAANTDDYNIKQRHAFMQEAFKLNKQRYEIEAKAAARNTYAIGLELAAQVKDNQAKIELQKQLKEAQAQFILSEANYYAEQKAMRKQMAKLDKELAAEADQAATERMNITRMIADTEAQVILQQQDAKIMAVRKTEATITDITYTEAQRRAMIAQAERDTKIQYATEMAQVASSLFKENTAAYKVTASAEALMSTYLSANKALAQLPIPFSFIMAALLTAKGLQNVAQINNVKFASGGVVPSGHELPGSHRNEDNTLALVKPGEVVLNQQQQSALGGPSTFSSIGVPGFANGGIVPSIKAPTPSPSGMDMSRLAAAMRDQRVFVLESDITKTQKNVRVIESLSSF